MKLNGRDYFVFKPTWRAFSVACLVLLAVPAELHAQKQEEFDEYKIRLDAGWFYSGYGRRVNRRCCTR